MSRAIAGPWARATDAWTSLLLRCYPLDFREEMGPAMRDAYRDRFDDALRERGAPGLVAAWFAALGDALRNGTGERVQPSIGWRRSGRWGRDGERVVRRLVRAPVFALSVVATIGVGLAAFAVVYTAVANVLLAPLPYDRPEGLHFVWRSYPWIDLDRGWTAGSDVAALAKRPEVEAAAALRPATGVTLTMANDRGDARPREVRRMNVSPELFTILGVPPMLGRVFHANEVGPDRPAQVVMSYELWSSLGADSALVGRDVRLEGEPYRVIGVMPRGFRFVRHSSLGAPERADLYATLQLHIAETNPGAGAFAALVRRRDGVSPEAFAAAVAAVGAAVDRDHMRSRGMTLYAVDAREDLVKDVRPAIVVTAIAATLLVVVLTANLASLLLVRASGREREFAISRALGADGAAIARATVLEGAVLGAVGGALGAALALWGSRTLMGLTPLDFPRREALALDAGGALVTVLVGLTLGIVAGLIPALWAARLPLGGLVAASARAGGGRRGLVRRGILVAQVALSFILLCSGALVVRTLGALLRSDPGFRTADVMTLRIPITQARFPTNADANRIHQAVEDRLRAIPGVESVGAVSVLPMTAATDQNSAQFPGAPGNTGETEHDAPLVDIFTARAGFVETLGIRVLEGTPFQRPYRAGRTEVMIDATLARTFFPNGGAVGRTVRIGDDSAVVAAVIAQPRQYDLHADGRGQVYLRDEVSTYGTLSWTLRTTVSPASLAPAIDAAIRDVDPGLAVADLRPMESIVEDALRQRRLTATLVSGFAVTALLLTAVGLFGTVASAVLKRRHELAVRMALGAHHGAVLRLLLGESARLVVLGLLIAVPGFVAAGVALERVLVGVSRWDPLSLTGVTLGLAGVALVASWLPARRVLGIQPGSALRGE
jgi:putative ABC transport system permease protein